MNRYTLIAAAALAAGGLTYTGCDRDDTASNTGTSNASGTSGTYDRSSNTATTGPTTGDRVNNATDNAGDALARAADNTGDALGRAADRTKEGVENAAEKTREVAGNVAAGTKEAANNAGEKLSGAAQTAGARIGGATDRAADRAQTGAQGTAAAPDAEGIRDILASVTEAALTEDGLDDLTERLVDGDRNKIGSAIANKSPEHTALVQQFRADWKAKYGQDFDVTNEQTVYPDAMFKVTQGEISNAAPSGAEVATGQRGGDLNSNQEAGRNIATVAIASSQGMPGLTVPLLHELPDNWRIDAPNSLTADKLRSNVISHLQAAHAMKDKWPADVNQAYAAVSHHVLMAILDQPVQSK